MADDEPTLGDLTAQLAAAERATALARHAAASHEQAKQAAQAEIAKLTAANARQQLACRELQLSTKALCEEVDVEAETTRRTELEGKFEGTIGDIRGKMAEQEAEVARLVEENERSAARLAGFGEQHAAVRKHQAAEANMRTLQEQLAVAKLREAEQLRQEQARRAALLQAHAARRAEAEAAAREQVEAYHERFGQLNETLGKSAEVFGQLREQAGAAG